MVGLKKIIDTFLIFKVLDRHWVIQQSMANENVRENTCYHVGARTQMLSLDSWL